MPQVFQPHDALPVLDPLIVLYGTPGSGKTSLAMTADDPEMWDVDLGVQRAVGRKRVVRFADYADLLAYVKPGGDFESQPNRPKTLIVDTAGALLDDFIGDYVTKIDKRNGKPGGGGVSLQGFGAMKDVFGALLRRCRQLDVLPLFICHSVEKQDGDNMRLRPKMTGGAYDVLVSKADLVGYMEMLDNRVTINFNPTSRQIGKNCVGFPVMTVPHFEQPEYHGFMQRIIDQTRARLAAMSEEQRAALERVKELLTEVAGASSLPELDAVTQALGAEPAVIAAQVQQPLDARWAAVWGEQHIAGTSTLDGFNNLLTIAKTFGETVTPGAKKLLRKALNAAAEEQGLAFDKEAGAFTVATAPPATEVDETGGAGAAVDAAGIEAQPLGAPAPAVPPLPEGLPKLPGAPAAAEAAKKTSGPRKATNAELSKA